MLNRFAIFFLGTVVLTFSLVSSLQADEAFWGCKDKDQRALRTTGGNDKEKQADCLKQGGSWENLSLASPATGQAQPAAQAPAKPQAPQSTGGGGGW